MNSLRTARRKQAIVKLENGASREEVMAFLLEKECCPELATTILDELIPCPVQSLRCRMLFTLGILGCGAMLNFVIFSANGAFNPITMGIAIAAPLCIWARAIAFQLARRGFPLGPKNWQIDREIKDTYSNVLA